MHLVDTNVISELMRQRPDPGVLSWLERHQTVFPKLTISAVTVDEISYGLTRRPTQRLLAWFNTVVLNQDTLPVTADIARRAGELRAQLETRGSSRSQADMMIAATAQLHGLTIVTRNVRDFAPYPLIHDPWAETA